MNYISCEAFISADGKVQKEILSWWTPSIGDYVFSKQDFREANIGLIEPTPNNFEYVRAAYIPLLTLEQLIKFIEWKTGGPIRKIEYIDNSYVVVPSGNNSMKWYKDGKVFSDVDLLFATWKAAQGICEDNIIELNFNKLL